MPAEPFAAMGGQSKLRQLCPLSPGVEPETVA